MMFNSKQQALLTGALLALTMPLATTVSYAQVTEVTPTNQVALADQDRQFINDAAQINMLEIKTAQLALDKSRNSNVLTLARRLRDDHQKAYDDLYRRGAAIGVTVPDTLDSAHQNVYDQLSSLNGDTFDRAYLNDMADGHTQAIGIFSDETSQGRLADLRDYSTLYLPDLRTHRDMIESDIAMLNTGNNLANGVVGPVDYRDSDGVVRSTTNRTGNYSAVRSYDNSDTTTTTTTDMNNNNSTDTTNTDNNDNNNSSTTTTTTTPVAPVRGYW